MKILMTGATGLVGTALGRAWREAGHDLVRLVRRREQADGVHAFYWNPEEGTIDTAVLAGVGAVVHLAGENVAARWTEERKRRIRESRVKGTQLLAEAVAAMEQPPAVFLCASAIGFYGERGDEVLDETAAPGEGFLPEVCRAWEAAADPVRARGIRTVHARISVVLAREGGALPAMLPPFRAGIAGRLGNGRQWMSWIHIDDLVRAFDCLLNDAAFEGAVNLAAPETVSNRDYTRELARAIRRPALLPVPGWVLQVLLGEMARGMILASTRVTPARLEAAGFDFRYPTIKSAFADLLGGGKV